MDVFATQALVRLLRQWTEWEGDEADLDLSGWVELPALRLRAAALQPLLASTGLLLQSVDVGPTKLRLPLHALLEDPWRLQCERLTAVLRLPGEMSEEAAAQFVAQRRQQLLEALRTAALQKLVGRSDAGLWASLLANVLHSLQLRVRNIHIRIITPSGSGGLVIGKLAANTVSERGDVRFAGSADDLRKLISLDDVCAYWDAKPVEPVAPLDDIAQLKLGKPPRHGLLCQPLSLGVRIARSPDGDWTADVASGSLWMLRMRGAQWQSLADALALLQARGQALAGRLAQQEAAAPAATAEQLTTAARQLAAAMKSGAASGRDAALAAAAAAEDDAAAAGDGRSLLDGWRIEDAVQAHVRAKAGIEFRGAGWTALCGTEAARDVDAGMRSVIDALRLRPAALRRKLKLSVQLESFSIQLALPAAAGSSHALSAAAAAEAAGGDAAAVAAAVAAAESVIELELLGLSVTTDMQLTAQGTRVVGVHAQLQHLLVKHDSDTLVRFGILNSHDTPLSIVLEQVSGSGAAAAGDEEGKSSAHDAADSDSDSDDSDAGQQGDAAFKLTVHSDYSLVAWLDDSALLFLQRFLAGRSPAVLAALLPALSGGTPSSALSKIVAAQVDLPLPVLLLGSKSDRQLLHVSGKQLHYSSAASGDTQLTVEGLQVLHVVGEASRQLRQPLPTKPAPLVVASLPSLSVQLVGQQVDVVLSGSSQLTATTDQLIFMRDLTRTLKPALMPLIGSMSPTSLFGNTILARYAKQFSALLQEGEDEGEGEGEAGEGEGEGEAKQEGDDAEAQLTFQVDQFHLSLGQPTLVVDVQALKAQLTASQQLASVDWVDFAVNNSAGEQLVHVGLGAEVEFQEGIVALQLRSDGLTTARGEVLAAVELQLRYEHASGLFHFAPGPVKLNLAGVRMACISQARSELEAVGKVVAALAAQLLSVDSDLFARMRDRSASAVVRRVAAELADSGSGGAERRLLLERDALLQLWMPRPGGSGDDELLLAATVREVDAVYRFGKEVSLAALVSARFPLGSLRDGAPERELRLSVAVTAAVVLHGSHHWSGSLQLAEPVATVELESGPLHVLRGGALHVAAQRQPLTMQVQVELQPVQVAVSVSLLRLLAARWAIADAVLAEFERARNGTSQKLLLTLEAAGIERYQRALLLAPQLTVAVQADALSATLYHEEEEGDHELLPFLEWRLGTLQGVATAQLRSASAAELASDTTARAAAAAAGTAYLGDDVDDSSSETLLASGTLGPLSMWYLNNPNWEPLLQDTTLQLAALRATPDSRLLLTVSSNDVLELTVTPALATALRNGSKQQLKAVVEHGATVHNATGSQVAFRRLPSGALLLALGETPLPSPPSSPRGRAPLRSADGSDSDEQKYDGDDDAGGDDDDDDGSVLGIDGHPLPSAWTLATVEQLEERWEAPALRLRLVAGQQEQYGFKLPRRMPPLPTPLADGPMRFTLPPGGSLPLPLAAVLSGRGTLWTCAAGSGYWSRVLSLAALHETTLTVGMPARRRRRLVAREELAEAGEEMEAGSDAVAGDEHDVVPLPGSSAAASALLSSVKLSSSGDADGGDGAAAASAGRALAAAVARVEAEEGTPSNEGVVLLAKLTPRLGGTEVALRSSIMLHNHTDQAIELALFSERHDPNPSGAPSQAASAFLSAGRLRLNAFAAIARVESAAVAHHRTLLSSGSSASTISSESGLLQWEEDIYLLRRGLDSDGLPTMEDGDADGSGAPVSALSDLLSGYAPGSDSLLKPLRPGMAVMEADDAGVTSVPRDCWTVDFRAPFQVTNLLPWGMQVHSGPLPDASIGERPKLPPLAQLAAGESQRLTLSDPWLWLEEAALALPLADLQPGTHPLPLQQSASGAGGSALVTVKEDACGTLDVRLFAPFWVINHSGLPLQYRVADERSPTHPGQRLDDMLAAVAEAEEEGEDGLSALPVAPFLLGAAASTSFALRVYGGDSSLKSRWSEQFVLSPMKESGELDVVGESGNWTLGVSFDSAPAAFGVVTTTVTIVQRFMVVNTMEHVLQFSQVGIDWQEDDQLQPGQFSSLFLAAGAPSQLRLRVAAGDDDGDEAGGAAEEKDGDGEEAAAAATSSSPSSSSSSSSLIGVDGDGWSPGFALNSLRPSDFMLPSGMFLRLEVKEVRGTVWVIVREPPPGQPPYMLVNRSSAALVVQQLGLPYPNLALPAGGKLPFAWMAHHPKGLDNRAVVTFQRAQGRFMLERIGPGPTLAGRDGGRLFTWITPSDGTMEVIFSDVPLLQSELPERTRALLRAQTMSRHMLRQLPTAVGDDVLEEGDDIGLLSDLDSMSGLEDEDDLESGLLRGETALSLTGLTPDAVDAMRKQREGSSVQLLISLAGVAVSVVDSAPTEVLYAHAEGIELSLLDTPAETAVDLSVATLQVDNQLHPLAESVVVLSPLRMPRDETVERRRRRHAGDDHELLEEEEEAAASTIAGVVAVDADGRPRSRRSFDSMAEGGPAAFDGHVGDAGDDDGSDDDAFASSSSPQLLVSWSKLKGEEGDMHHIPQLRVALAPMELSLDSRLLQHCLHLLASMLPASLLAAAAAEQAAAAPLASWPAFAPQDVEALVQEDGSQQLYVGELTLAPVLLRVTYRDTHAAGQSLQLPSTLPGAAGRLVALLRSYGSALTAFDGTAVALAGLNARHRQSSSRSWRALLTRHYSRQLNEQLLRVLMRVKLLRNSLGLTSGRGGMQPLHALPDLRQIGLSVVSAATTLAGWLDDATAALHGAEGAKMRCRPPRALRAHVGVTPFDAGDAVSRSLLDGMKLRTFVGGHITHGFAAVAGSCTLLLLTTEFIMGCHEDSTRWLPTWVIPLPRLRLLKRSSRPLLSLFVFVSDRVMQVHWPNRAEMARFCTALRKALDTQMLPAL